MKPSRVLTFLIYTSGVVALSSAHLSAQGVNWVAGASDWGATSSWSSGAIPTISNTANFGANSTPANTHFANLYGPRQIGGIVTTNTATTSSVEILGGNGNQTLGIGTAGITHNRSAFTIGSVTEGQKVNVSLLGTQTWTSSTSQGGATAVAMFVLNDVSLGVAGNHTLTLTGINTGSKIDGAVSDGAGILGLTKNSTNDTSIWTLNGPVSYSGPTTVTRGILRLNHTLGFNSSSVTLGNNTTLGLAVGGTTGMPVTKFESILATGTFPSSSTLEILTPTPVHLTLTGGLQTFQSHLGKGSNAELSLAGTNSRTTTTAISGGILRLRDFQSGGVPSPIGASSSDPNNLRFAAGTRLIYDGPETTSDRLLTLAGAFTFESAGTGPLKLTNPGIHPGNTGGRTVVLLGSNRGDNHIAGTLGVLTRTDSSINKRGGGTWRISGNQPSASGATYRIEEGKLTFDFSTGNDPFSPGTLLLNGGELVLRGNGVGISKTIPTLNAGSTQISRHHFKLENGFALTANQMTANQTQRNDLIDLYDPTGTGTNSLTIGSLAGTLGVVNGIVMVNATTSAGRASIVLRAPDGTYGFLGLSGGTSGTAQKVGGLIEPVAGSLTMNVNDNYLLKAGSYTAAADLRFNTIHFNSDNGAVVLSVPGGRKLQPSGQGKAMLFTGNNDITITGNVDDNDAAEDNATWFHNYLPSGKKLNLEVGLGIKPGTTTIFGGTGTTYYSGEGFVGNFVLTGGCFRYTKEQAMGVGDRSPTFKIGSGATLEIGARLMDPYFHPADLVKQVDGTAGGIRLYGDAGLSAYTATPNGVRTVCFSTYVLDWKGDPVFTTQPLKWGANYFLTVSESENNTDGDNSLVLSSPTSNAMIEIQNPIDLNGRSRTVEVVDGSAPIDARLSGFLTGDAASGIVKRGAGTLQLTGINSYTGETRVMEGVLMIDGSTLDPQSRLWIDNGATLNINAGSTVHVSSVFINGVQYFGTVTHPSITGGGTLISDAPLTPYAQWVIDKALGSAVSGPLSDADSDGIRNLVEYAVGSEPKSPNGSVLTITGASPRQIKFSHPSGRTDITAYVESSPGLDSPWTVIATSTVGNPFTSSVANVTTSEVANQVTITDNRTPAAAKMFYRLRVEK